MTRPAGQRVPAAVFASKRGTLFPLGAPSLCVCSDLVVVFVIDFLSVVMTVVIVVFCLCV